MELTGAEAVTPASSASNRANSACRSAILSPLLAPLLFITLERERVISNTLPLRAVLRTMALQPTLSR